MRLWGSYSATTEYGMGKKFLSILNVNFFRLNFEDFFFVSAQKAWMDVYSIGISFSYEAWHIFTYKFYKTKIV